jgi:DNA-binding MarR family transcriptional regulator
MSIVTDQKLEIQSLQDELVSLRLNLENARERLYREETSNALFRAEQDYERRVFAIDNQILSGAQKIVFLAVRVYIYTLWDRSNALNERVEIPMGQIAMLTGLSRDTVGSSIKRLHKVGLVDRTQFNEGLKDGRRQTHVFVALTLLAESLELIPDVPKRDHGGDPERRLCKRCKSDKLVRRKRIMIVCEHCGCDQDETEETQEFVNPPDPLADVAPIIPLDLDIEEASERFDVGESERPDVQTLECEPDEVVEGHPRIEPSVATSPPPEWDCDKCGSQNWIWKGRRYRCATCNPRLLARQADDGSVASSAPIIQIKGRRPPKPTVPCKHCSSNGKVVISWVWTDEDGGGYICLSCYSSPVVEKVGREWMPF